MTDASAQQLYRRWIEEVWNGAPGAVREMVTDDFTGHWPGRRVRGPGELAAMIADTRAMFAELRFEIEVAPFAGGGFVAGRWRGVGRTPEGARARFFGNDILRLEGGRFAEYWVASAEER